MRAGNIEPKVTLKMEYLDYRRLPFKQTRSEIRIVLRPHQTKSISNPDKCYHPLDLDCPIREINCVCLEETAFDIFNELIDQSGIQATLIWLDPSLLPTECLASIIINWKKRLIATQNVALGIVIPEGNTKVRNDAPPIIWKASISGPLYVNSLTEPIWYPSLARDREWLFKASKNLDPYNLFPLIEFPSLVNEMGEQSVTDHALMLEECRARTRNFIYFDILHVDRTFEQFYHTIKALPRMGPSVFQSIITPGGSTHGFLTALVSGVLAEAYFLTPKKEIPIDFNTEPQGIMVLRKCV